MSSGTGIEWTDVTWNPSTGCSKVSAGCKHCYAELMAERLRLMGQERYVNGFEFTIQWDKIDTPRHWLKPRMVFVNSMSDFFHEDSTLEFIEAVFRTMLETPRHTKRPERLAEWLTTLQQRGVYRPAAHIWLSTSIKDARVADRADALRATPALVRFLSCEPLLGSLAELDLSQIDWLIAGGESGTQLHQPRIRQRRGLVECIDGAWLPRDDRIAWIREFRDKCAAEGVAFFFKQWGGPTPKAAGRLLDGHTHDEYPQGAGEPPEPTRSDPPNGVTRQRRTRQRRLDFPTDGASP